MSLTGEGLNGFINLYKPLGMTSAQAVARVKRRIGKAAKIGHAGTLDPQAAGILPLMIGKATRLFDYVVDKQKTYLAVLRLGEVTDTQDAQGQVLETRPVTATLSDLLRVLPKFVGTIQQVPPMYSALKRDGRPLYELARNGEVLELEARPVEIYSIELTEQADEKTYHLLVTCGKGTYIRTLCHDIGAALGCGGHMLALERACAGFFMLENAVTIEACMQVDDLSSLIIPMDAPLAHIPAVHLEASCMAQLRNGVMLADWVASWPEGAFRVYCDGQFAGMARLEVGTPKFACMLLERG